MTSLPDYAIFLKKTSTGELLVRKLGDKTAGICIEKKNHDFPFTASAEFFINREAAVDLIKALQQYFKIGE